MRLIKFYFLPFPGTEYCFWSLCIHGQLWKKRLLKLSLSDALSGFRLVFLDNLLSTRVSRLLGLCPGDSVVLSDLSIHLVSAALYK